MLTTAPSATAASSGVAETSTSLDALHHHAWLVLQTGLGHAPRAVLHTIVEEHAHFQARSAEQTFFMARSRLEPVLPRGMQWRTFTNHRSALVKLGLIELVWRAPNQHSDRSRWRIRYDRTISAQPREQLPLPIEETVVQASVSDTDAVSEQPLGKRPEDGSNANGQPSDEPSGGQAYLGRQIAQMKLWLASGEERLAELEARFEALLSAERNVALEAEDQPAVIPRAERRRRERLAAKQARGSPVDVNSPFLRAVVAAMKELDIVLADDDLARFGNVERLWRERHTGDIPAHFLPYAIQRMRESKRDRPVGYVLGVLRSTVEKGYTEDMPSGEEMRTGRQRYQPRKNRY